MDESGWSLEPLARFVSIRAEYLFTVPLRVVIHRRGKNLSSP